MQTGKIILSAAALVVTAASSLAFKAANKFTSGHTLFVQVTSFQVNVACVTCRSVRTKASTGINIASCATAVHGSLVKARASKTFFTSRTTVRKVNCLTPFTKATKSL